jgi:SNF2 family DNA or RNA helicase
MIEIKISFDAKTNNGTVCTSDGISSIWERLINTVLTINPDALIKSQQIILPWYQILVLVRDYIPLQKDLGFKFTSDSTSKPLLDAFIREQKSIRDAQSNRISVLSEEAIALELKAKGFTKRSLIPPFQVRDVQHLISLPNGANFSVPGAGKTTVALAVHLLTSHPSDKMLVVCPKAAFPAWSEIISECIDPSYPDSFSTGFFVSLSTLSEDQITQSFSARNRYYFINYEQFVSKRSLFSFLLSNHKTHLVLDESHRMKAGILSQRGTALLSVANLPIRKDILSGTPMPQGPQDIQSQLDFLYPGARFSSRIMAGEPPRTVIEGLFTRTTKAELGLPDVDRHFVKVNMTKAQAALYGVIKSETLRQLSLLRDSSIVDVTKARKSVLRLIQLASNPILALRGIAEDNILSDFSLLNAVLEENSSAKIDEVVRIVRENAGRGKKTLVWTIFTQNILDIERALIDLDPVTIYGEIPSGADTDETTREGRLKKFKDQSDPCMVLIANPAAAGEGISLHMTCHDAVYLDRSYNATHYLQSIDRIHRLGLPSGTETNITIVQIAPPAGLGSIDYSVSRRLAKKIRDLEALLDDPDLRQIALDEENAAEPTDYSLNIDDVADLIEELEGRTRFDENEMI